MKHENMLETNALQLLGHDIKYLLDEHEDEQCKKMIYDAMRDYPHAPEPHNWAGIMMEKEGDRLLALKHFRAAYALDPTYLPARHNINLFVTFNKGGNVAFDTTDINEIKK